MSKTKILIPLDGSEYGSQVFSAIRAFFAPEDTQLILFEAVDREEIPKATSDAVLASDAMADVMLHGGARYVGQQEQIRKRQFELSEAALHQDEKQLSWIGRELEEAGYAVTSHAEAGEPAEEIVQYASVADVDLIAMATHGRSGLSKLIMGSVAEKVLRESHVPVLLLRPSV